MSALAQDERLAEWWLSTHDDDEDRDPPLVGYGRLEQGIDAIRDDLHMLTATVVALAGGKAGRVQPVPRPKTAVDRARSRKPMELHRQLVALMLPKPSE